MTRRCQAEGVIAGLVLDEADLATDPHLQARRFWRPNGSEEVGWHDYPGHPWRWNDPPLRGDGLCPFGAANDEVWSGVAGLDATQLAVLREGGHLLDHYVNVNGEPL